MMNAPLPPNEQQRLAALRQLNILDTPAERDFDDLVSLAAELCRTPIALISLIDADRQWFKAKVGLATTETSREVSFCAHAILLSDLLVVPDAVTDERFSKNPLVTADPPIRFYAGAPLVTSDGYALGTLCVIDHVPRQLQAHEADVLRALSRQVLAQIELRRANAELVRTVAESRAIEEELRTSEEFKTRMIESSGDCIKVLDLEGRLLSMNQGGMELLEICDLAPFVNSSLDRVLARGAPGGGAAGGRGRSERRSRPIRWILSDNADRPAHVVGCGGQPDPEP